jgi:hypothetical protein
MRRCKSSWILSLTVLFSALAFAAPLTEEQKIDALIHSIEVLPGAQFIRNGSAYDGKAAAEHLRRKRSYAGDRIKTAGDFITYCASRSSSSGKAYQIRFANGETVDAEAFLRAELKRIEAAPADVRDMPPSNR